MDADKILCKILWKTKPKSLPKKSEQNNNIIQDKVNSIEDKDEKTWESYYSKGNAEPITKTDV